MMCTDPHKLRSNILNIYPFYFFFIVFDSFELPYIKVCFVKNSLGQSLVNY